MHALRRQQSRRAVELQAGAVPGRVQRGVRRLVRHQVKQRVPHGQLLAWAPVRGPVQRLPVQQDRYAVVRRHLAAPVADDHPQRQRGNPRVVEHDTGAPGDQGLARVHAADVGRPEPERVHRARVGPARDSQLGHPGGFWPRAPGRIAQADHAAVQHRGIREPHVTGDPVTADEQRRDPGPGRAVHQAVQLRRYPRHRRLRGGVDQHIGPAACRWRHHRHRQLHDRPSYRGASKPQASSGPFRALCTSRSASLSRWALLAHPLERGLGPEGSARKTAVRHPRRGEMNSGNPVFTGFTGVLCCARRRWERGARWATAGWQRRRPSSPACRAIGGIRPGSR